MTTIANFLSSGRQLAGGFLLTLVLAGGPRASQAAGFGWPGLRAGHRHAAEQSQTRQHLHRKGLFHWLVQPGCNRHHRIH